MQKRSFRNNLHKLWAIVLCIGLITACGNTGSANTGASIKGQKETTIEKAEFLKKEDKVEPSAKKQTENKDKTEEKNAEVKLPKMPKDQYHEVSFLAVGDVMVHKEQLKRAYVPATDSFDFVESFVYAQPFIESATYAFANLETTLAGRSQNTTSVTGSMYKGYSGYPNFNAPESLGDALKWAGFDFIGTANNHSLDKGLNGVINTLAYLRQIGLPYTGTFDTAEERNTLKVVEVGGLKIGVIAYTYATNGIYLKPEDMYRVNTLDNYQAERIAELYETVKRAKQQPIDLLFVMMHYGNEYWEKPEKHYQAGITQELIRLGVDMVIGSHPHTLQPLIYTEQDAVLLKKSEQAQLPVNLTANPQVNSQTSAHKAEATENAETANKAEKTEGKPEALAQTEINAQQPVTAETTTGQLPWDIAGIYSLGNFISSQRVISEYKTDTDTGAMIKWVYQWKNQDKPTLVKIGIIPTIVVWQDDRATVLPINDISIAAAKADPTMAITPYVESRIANAQKTVLKRLTTFLPDSLIQSMQTEGDGFTYLYLHEEIKAK
ncbi:CapA family protein [Clostridiales bacterium COT073_COT-073]|nr:CapA family protein [Clostridiales bacterium COT073_COT-073]